MGAALPPHNCDDGNVVTGGNIHSRAFNDEEHCASEDPLPPPLDGDGGDAEKMARGRTRHARLILAVGIFLEACATLWAFQQVVAAGAFDGDVDCSSSGGLQRLHLSPLVVDACDGPLDADYFYNLTDTSDGLSYPSFWQAFDVCDTLTDVPTGEHSFEESCTCQSEDFEMSDMCSWVALSSPSDGYCFAQSVLLSISENGGTDIWADNYFQRCWDSNPSGTEELAIAALVVALCVQLLEAFVGFKYWKDTAKGTTPTLAVSVLEALGVIAVASVLLSLPGLYAVSDDTSRRIPGFVWSAWTTVTIAVVGALVEIAAGCSDRALARLPYLGAVGNACIWFGAALLEVVVTLYLLYVGAGITGDAELAREGAVLFVLEILGLVAMWVARGLWTRAKLLRSSMGRLERPPRKGVMSAPLKRRSQSCEPAGAS